MLRHLTAACLAAFLALNAASPRVAAKPPDLPDDDPIIVTEPVETPKAEGVCPRCADRRAQPECDPKTMPSVLDNLRILQKAAAEIDLARKLCAAGKFTEARDHLEKARKRCPGSSQARRAAEMMQEINSDVIHELLQDGFTSGPVGAAEESPCPAPCCETLARIRNAGACYMTRLGFYCDKVQATAAQGCCCDKECATKCEKQQGSVTIELSVNSDSGLIGSIVVNERTFSCGKGYESACPKCEKMHQEVMKRARQKAAGVKEQVDGLMKACYFAAREGRNAKAADLARQAHALDPKRVEADPLVYKLHMLAEKGQCEECETPRETSPACPKCPTDPVENNVSLRPSLPAVDPEIVPALDRVLTKRWVGADGFERVGVDFGSGSEELNEAAESSCCPCCDIAKQVGAACLGMFLSVPPKDFENGYVVVGLGTNGINVSSLSKYAGMKILVQYQGGLPIVWVASDSASR
jgi:hypothetical protein